MNCPKCSIPLFRESLTGSARVALPYRTAPVPDPPEDQESASIWVDRCSSCDGIWFDGGEMTQAIRSLALVNLPELPEGMELSREGEPCPCPRCSHTMDVVKSRAAPAVIYERCSRCEGIWFDAGEARCFADADVAMLALMIHEFG